MTITQNLTEEERQTIEAAKHILAQTVGDIVSDHKEAVTAMQDERLLADFADRLTPEDYEEVFKKPAPDKLREALKMPTKTKNDRALRAIYVASCFDSVPDFIRIYEAITPSGFMSMPTSSATFAVAKTMNLLQHGRLSDLKWTSHGDYICTEFPSDKGLTTIRLKNTELINEIIGKEQKNGDGKGRKNGDLLKMFAYILIKCNEQYFNNPVVIDIHDLVKVGMYCDYTQAYRSFDKYMKIIYETYDYSIYIKRGSSEKETGVGMGHGFISRWYRNPGSSMAEIYIDNNFDTDLLFEYYTILPQWSFKLSPNAFALLAYIFRQARQEQNCENIAKNGSYNIGIESIRSYMGLPKDTEKDAYNKIRRPIEAAINDLEKAINENKDDNIKLVPFVKGEDILTAKTKAWLAKGYIKITLLGNYKSYLTDLYKRKIKRTEEAKK